MKNERLQNWFRLPLTLLGVWIIISPWIIPHVMRSADINTFEALSNLYPVKDLGATAAAMWNMYLVGLAVAASAAMAIVMFRSWMQWSTMALGGWLLISPWVLGFGSSVALTWNSNLAGAAIVVLSGWTLATARKDEIGLLEIRVH